jgi:hypothetical protein
MKEGVSKLSVIKSVIIRFSVAAIKIYMTCMSPTRVYFTSLYLCAFKSLLGVCDEIKWWWELKRQLK